MTFEEMKVPELKSLAKSFGIENADAMKKQELIEALEKVDGGKEISSQEKSLDLSPEHLKEEEVQVASHSDDVLADHPKFDKFKKSPVGEN